MTEDQKISHIEWYMYYSGQSKSAEVKRHYLTLATGALHAWYADLSLTPETFQEYDKKLNEMLTEVL
jgi:hypothetical protein